MCNTTIDKVLTKHTFKLSSIISLNCLNDIIKLFFIRTIKDEKYRHHIELLKNEVKSCLYLQRG